MPNIIAYQRMRLARMVLPLGEKGDGPIQPSAWAWLPPDEGDIVRIRIPIKLIEQLLERKRNQPDKPQPARKARSPIGFTLPLARVVLPLKGSTAKP